MSESKDSGFDRDQMNALLGGGFSERLLRQTASGAGAGAGAAGVTSNANANNNANANKEKDVSEMTVHETAAYLRQQQQQQLQQKQKTTASLAAGGRHRTGKVRQYHQLLSEQQQQQQQQVTGKAVTASTVVGSNSLPVQTKKPRYDHDNESDHDNDDDFAQAGSRRPRAKAAPKVVLAAATSTATSTSQRLQRKRRYDNDSDSDSDSSISSAEKKAKQQQQQQKTRRRRADSSSSSSSSDSESSRRQRLLKQRKRNVVVALVALDELTKLQNDHDQNDHDDLASESDAHSAAPPPPPPPPKKAVPALVVQRRNDHDDDDDDDSSSKDSGSGSEESSSSDDSSSSSEDDDDVMKIAKPVFVPKHKRGSVPTAADQEAQGAAAEEKMLQATARRQRESRAMVQQVVTAQATLKPDYETALEGITGARNAMPDDNDDDDNNDDNANIGDQAQDAWEVRELERLLADWDLEVARQKDHRELARRRGLTDDEKLQEDMVSGRYRRPGSRPDEEKQDTQQATRFFHKGAYYMDESEWNESDIRHKAAEYAKAATGSDKVDKRTLPAAMQVKKFGFANQTKYKGLAAEDTTDKQMHVLPLVHPKGGSKRNK
jgi:microfibrillar-associated protein 1